METARIFKTCKFRPRPTDDQAARLEQWFASARWICNAALEQRETYGRRKGTDLHGRPSPFKGCGKKTDDVIIQDSEVGWRMLSNDPDLAWLTDMPSACRQVALQDLDKAFDRFFRKQRGFPTFRTRARNTAMRCSFDGFQMGVLSATVDPEAISVDGVLLPFWNARCAERQSMW